MADRSSVRERRHRDQPFTVTAESIASFCAAIDETNPLYLDPVAAEAGPHGAIIAPPGYIGSFGVDDVLTGIPAFSRGSLMASLDIEFGTPIRVGDSISISSELKETYEKTGRTGTMTFAVVRSTLTNQNGEVVGYVSHRMMTRR